MCVDVYQFKKIRCRKWNFSKRHVQFFCFLRFCITNDLRCIFSIKSKYLGAGIFSSANFHVAFETLWIYVLIVIHTDFSSTLSEITLVGLFNFSRACTVVAFSRRLHVSLIELDEHVSAMELTKFLYLRSFLSLNVSLFLFLPILIMSVAQFSMLNRCSFRSNVDNRLCDLSELLMI